MSNWLFPASPSFRDLTNPKAFRYQWRNNGPIITEILVAICLIVWILEVLGAFLIPVLYNILAINGTMIPAIVPRYPWTLITSMFMHDPRSLFHILFNMLALWSAGPMLERMMGHWQFLSLYLLAGLGGDALMIAIARATGDVTLWVGGAYGASGAIFGLFAAIAVVYRRIGQDITGILVLMAINFAMPLFIPHIAWQVHVGGFLIGGLYTWLLTSGIPALRQYSFTVRTWIYGGVLGVLIIAGIAMCYIL